MQSSNNKRLVSSKDSQWYNIVLTTFFAPLKYIMDINLALSVVATIKLKLKSNLY
jgi:hypothetical protein